MNYTLREDDEIKLKCFSTNSAKLFLHIIHLYNASINQQIKNRYHIKINRIQHTTIITTKCLHNKNNKKLIVIRFWIVTITHDGDGIYSLINSILKFV